MPQLSENSVQLLNGKLVLTRRNRSPYWQARYRVGGRWLRTSTKCTGVREAEEAANSFYVRAQIKDEMGLPVITRKFRRIAEAVRSDLESQVKVGAGKSVYKDYITVINRYLIPFFGNRNIDAIDAEMLSQFSAFRRESMGREPAKSTINTHSAALNRIFDEAVAQGYLTRAKVPEIRRVGEGVTPERRPDFTRTEYIKLYTFMRGWANADVHTSKSKQMRLLLRDLVLILANTGIRYGTEIYNLKWKNLNLEKEKVTVNGERLTKEYLYVHVNGKTGKRKLVARRRCKAWFKRIYDRSADLQHITFDELLEKGADKYVFRLPDGTRTKNLHQTFRRLLDDSGLSECRETEQVRTLYSLRHTYATLELVKGLSIHKLAIQMGTSVKMIEKHYSHLSVVHARDELSGQMKYR